MNSISLHPRAVLNGLNAALPTLSCLIVLCCAPFIDAKAENSVLAGTWTLVQADVISADGKQEHDYGPAPKGQFIIDSEGHYSLQIYDTSRPKYASGDKKTGTPDEYKANVIGISTHFGTIDVDAKSGTLTLHIESASLPNQESTLQKRYYELKGDELSYHSAQARKDGSVPVSIWRRLK
jgi:hypothetical protein